MKSEETTKGISINAVGDILLADAYLDIGYGIGSQIKKKGDFFPFEKITGYFENRDVLIGNLECPLSSTTPNRGLRSKEFLASPVVVGGLKRIGFDALLVANNHMLQHGPEAYKETIEYLKNAGMQPVGRVLKTEAPQSLAKIVCKDMTLGFLGYSMTKNTNNSPANEFAHHANKEDILEGIHSNRKECDYLILMLHWGEEFVARPSKVQVELAHQFIDEGADVIIGSHPHVLQGVESYRGKTIAYSLGNFVFNMPAPMCRKTAILSVKVGLDDTQESNLQPVWINQYGQPEIPSGKVLSDIDKTIKIISKELSKEYQGDDEYRRIIETGLSTHRKWVKRAFIENINRVEKQLILQMIYEYILRRIDECLKKKAVRIIS